MKQEEASTLADRMNNLTPAEIASAMEKLPTDVLEWAVAFESMATKEGQ